MNSRLLPTLSMTKVLFDVRHLCGAVCFLYGMDSFIPLHTKARSALDLLSSNTQYTCHCDRLLLLNCRIATMQVTNPQPTMISFSGLMVLLAWPLARPMRFSLLSMILIGLGIVCSQLFRLSSLSLLDILSISLRS